MGPAAGEVRGSDGRPDGWRHVSQHLVDGREDSKRPRSSGESHFVMCIKHTRVWETFRFVVTKGAAEGAHGNMQSEGPFKGPRIFSQRCSLCCAKNDRNNMLGWQHLIMRQMDRQIRRWSHANIETAFQEIRNA